MSAADVALQVEMLLLERGYAVSGYHSGPLPAVTTGLLLGRWAEHRGKAIVLGEDIPEGCETISLGHELTHDALGRMLGIVGPESERVARDIQNQMAQDPWRPNCMSR